MLGSHAEELLEYGIDYEDAIDRFDGNVALYEKFVFRFLQDKNYDELCSLLEAGDVEQAARVAHVLKGVVGILSFNSYHENIDAVLAKLREGNFAEARRLMEAVDRDHEKVLVVLRKYQMDA